MKSYKSNKKNVLLKNISIILLGIVFIQVLIAVMGIRNSTYAANTVVKIGDFELDAKPNHVSVTPISPNTFWSFNHVFIEYIRRSLCKSSRPSCSCTVERIYYSTLSCIVCKYEACTRFSIELKPSV